MEVGSLLPKEPGILSNTCSGRATSYYHPTTALPQLKPGCWERSGTSSNIPLKVSRKRQVQHQVEGFGTSPGQASKTPNPDKPVNLSSSNKHHPRLQAFWASCIAYEYESAKHPVRPHRAEYKHGHAHSMDSQEACCRPRRPTGSIPEPCTLHLVS